jgi:ATP-dependent DNA helicase DinG
MAEAVARAIAGRRHLVVQAGTGTGKSLAYLVPVIRAGRTVVVATATKALQDQLATKDLPFLAGLAPGSFSFAVLKGRSNYLCRQRTSETGLTSTRPGTPVVQTFDVALENASDVPNADASQDSAPDGASSDKERETGSGTGLAQQIRRLATCAEQSPTGDRAELDFEPDPRAWAAVSVGPRECPGAYRCPSGAVCFTEQARARAAAADIVVVNTHLYATHVASGGVVLPEHDVVIFDEAHELEDVMTSGLGVELTPGRIRAVAQTARSLIERSGAAAVDALFDAADSLEEVIRPLAGRRVLSRPEHGATSLSGTAARARRASPIPAGEPLGLSIKLADPAPAHQGPDSGAPGARARVTTDTGSHLEAVLGVIDSRLAAVTQALRAADRPERGSDPDISSKRQRAVQAAAHLTADVRAFAAADSDQVAWVEGSGPGARQVMLRLAPIDVGPALAERLWPNVTGVLTSATIPPLAENRLGLPADKTDRLDVASPFPYRERAMLYCATDLPDRRTPQAEEAIADELAQLITAAGGRTLALFTSWRAMTATCDRLRPLLSFPIYAQGDLPKPKLLEAFSNDEAACLFATVSFWQGVDVPGRTLTLVAVDRLPFARPDDPLVQARRDRAGERAFSLVDLPRAATLLAQGAGRLIRSADDTGVVAVLDRRLATASYGRILRASLPPMRWTTDRRTVVGFLEHAVGGPG